MSVRGVPAQDLLENQDPDVLYVIDEVTKVVTPIAPAQEEAPKPRRRNKKDEPKETEDAADEPAAEGAGE